MILRTCIRVNELHLKDTIMSYLSVKLASSMGSSSNFSGRLLVLLRSGDEGSSSCVSPLLNMSFRSSSTDFRGGVDVLKVLARCLCFVVFTGVDGS